ncbi:MAG: DUF4126 domain-containing protein [Candidatus Omnitrophica bacterium]|nr:DUF4126 domain-containing protein [Candidatus Omnitrophota bacterium]
MQLISNLGMLLGGAWASGVNLYLTISVLGIADKLGWITLPGRLDVISHPAVIAVALLLTAIEFFADKIPLVDSVWDSFHTFIRPVGGGALAFLATSNLDPAFQLSAAMLGGTVALDSHLTKATARAAINTSPEPISNSIASVSEDGLVIGALWLIVQHPVVAGILVVLFIIFSIWFLRTMFRFLKKALRFFSGTSGSAGDPGSQ